MDTKQSKVCSRAHNMQKHMQKNHFIDPSRNTNACIQMLFFFCWGFCIKLEDYKTNSTISIEVRIHMTPNLLKCLFSMCNGLSNVFLRLSMNVLVCFLGHSSLYFILYFLCMNGRNCRLNHKGSTEKKTHSNIHICIESWIWRANLKRKNVPLEILS